MKLNVAVFTNPNRADNTISTSTHLQSYWEYVFYTIAHYTILAPVKATAQ